MCTIRGHREGFDFVYETVAIKRQKRFEQGILTTHHCGKMRGQLLTALLLAIILKMGECTEARTLQDCRCNLWIRCEISTFIEVLLGHRFQNSDTHSVVP